MSSSTANKLGITNRVKIVETNNPNNITFAKGDQVFDDPPIPNAIGINPEIVVKEVNIIGRNLSLPELTILLQNLKTLNFSSERRSFMK